jgi:hypothetical protein
MPCDLVQNIPGTECVGDSLSKINGNFANLETAVCVLSATTQDQETALNETTDLLNETALDSLIFQNMKTILRRADLTYDPSPSSRTVTFAQPWFKLEGLLAIINQTMGQVIYKVTQGGQAYDTGTRTLTLKSTVNLTGHNSTDVLVALYAQPGYSSPTTQWTAPWPDGSGLKSDTITSSPAILYGVTGVLYTTSATFTAPNGQVGASHSVVISSGNSTIMEADLYPSNTPDTIPSEGIFCPEGITVTAVYTSAVGSYPPTVSITYRLL